MTAPPAEPGALAGAVADLDPAGHRFVLEYLAAAAATNLEVRLAMARALSAEARTPLRDLEPRA